MTSDGDHPLYSGCKANGCPLKVEHVTRWWDDKKRKPRSGVCDFHRRADAEDWTATTRRIQSVLLYLRILDMVESVGDQRYRHGQTETVNHWLHRIRAQAEADILPDLHVEASAVPGDFSSLQAILDVSTETGGAG